MSKRLGIDSGLRRNDDTRGFSLIELSIGLVIVGLLTGGILAGQSLIRAAEVRSVITDFDKYKTATLQFRQKFDALPGDFSNAVDTWGAADPTPATCATTASSGQATCDGNEDGRINVSAGSNEYFRFWQHLANAGMIEGQFNGIQQGATIWGSTRANTPAGRISNTLWHIQYMGAVASGSIWFDGNYDNTFQVGIQFPDYDPANPFLKPEEAWNIDTKIDDGKPAVGKVVIRAQNGLSTCTTTSSTAIVTADYLLSNSNTACSLLFRNYLLKN
ncbi:MAG: type II secretion system protein [Rickettsiales bacterium]